MTQLDENYSKTAAWARKHGVSIVSGGDIFGVETYVKQNILNVVLEPVFGFSPYEAPMHHTGNAGKMLKEMELMEPELDSYSEGKLGVIEPVAYADFLVIDGTPCKV
jgi:imidazolonepropionase-like amidohydrolase